MINGIFLNLCQLIYPIIPKLYDLVTTLATIDLFDADNSGGGLEIRNNIWNNLYIVISVLVLFAIAIKLINAIVNPDVLTDKKNGVKNAYIKGIISVFLIVSLPIFFEVLQGVQDEIIGNNFIQKVIYGEITEGNPGQRLAVETARSFVKVADGVDDPFPGPTDELRDDEIQQIFNELEDNNAPKDDTGEYVTEFNPLLMLVSGIFVVYQLILIVLDVAVRTIKLRILELMVPAVIGGYIFKTDILKAWFKEYMKTFVQVFLLLITITLISLALGLLKSATNENFTLLVRLLLIFGVLTLAKQIPSLINTIFGTNIKGKGGVKGRLGEMAAVGGLAQQALGALKPLGMKALGAAGIAFGGLATLGAAGLGAAGAIGYGVAKKKWWDKGGKDTKLGRGLSTAGAVAKGIGTGVSKGVKSKGGIVRGIATAFDTGIKTYSATEIAKSNKATKEAKRTNTAKAALATAFGLEANGHLKEVNETTKNANLSDDAKKGRNKRASEKRTANIDNAINESYSEARKNGYQIDKEVADAQKAFKGKAVTNAMAQKADSKWDAVMADNTGYLDTLITRYSNSNPDLSAALKNLKGDIVTGKKSMAEALVDIKTNPLFVDENGNTKLEPGEVGKLNADMGAFNRTFNATFDDGSGNDVSLAQLFGANSSGQISVTGFKLGVQSTNNEFEDSKGTIENKMNENGITDNDRKVIVNKVTDNIVTTANELAAANSAYDKNNPEQESAYYGNTSSNTQTQSSGSTSGGRSTSGGGSNSNGGSTNTQSAPEPAPAQESSGSSYGPAPDYWGAATGATANIYGPAPDYWEMQTNGAPASTPIDVSSQQASQPTQSTQTTTTNVVNETKTETRTESSGDASYDSSSSSNSGGTGSGAGATVNATIDTRGIESKLDEINRSVNKSGESVSNAVNEQGKQITSRLDTANTYQKKTSEATQHIKDNLDSGNKPNGEE